MVLIKNQLAVNSDADVEANRLGMEPPKQITYARCIFNVLDVVCWYEDIETRGTYAHLRNGEVIRLQESFESIETKLFPDKQPAYEFPAERTST